jgi:hypothetical protein
MFKSPAVYALAALMITTTHASAQVQAEPPHKPHWEFIVNSGTLVPTGAQRDAIRRGNVTVAQLSYVVQEGLALTSSFGWARTRDVASADAPRLDMFTYDVGAELRADRWLEGGVLRLSPFAGIGAGGRSYNYRSLDVDATHNLAGYASAGAELGIGSRVKLRLEARDYVTGFAPLSGGGSVDARNDVTVMFGVRLRLRGS